MPGVNMPGAHQGLLDQVLKGVTIARDLYGIKTEMGQNDARAQAADQSAQKFSDEQAGVIAPDKFLEYSQHFNKGAEGDPGAIQVSHRTGEGDDGISKDWMIPQKTKSALQQHVIQGAVDPKTGETGAGIFDSDGGLVNFVKTAKAAKDPVAHYTPITDPTTGQTSLLNTATGDITDSVGTFGKHGTADPGGVDKKVVSHQADKLYDTFVKGGAKAEVGLLKQKIDGAEALQGILDAHPDGQIPPQFQTEMAIGMAKMIGGGAPTEGEINKMDPQTAGTLFANLVQKVTNKPYSANNPEFVKLFGETIAREKGIAQDQVGRLVQQGISFAPDLYKSDPNRFYGLVGAKKENFQISPEGDVAYVNKTIGKRGSAKSEGGPDTAIAAPSGSPAAPQAAFHPQASEAEKWANENINSKNPGEAKMAADILARIGTSEKADVPTSGGVRP